MIADTVHVPSLTEPRDAASGITALHAAIAANDLAAVRLLHAANAKSNQRVRGRVDTLFEQQTGHTAHKHDAVMS